MCSDSRKQQEGVMGLFESQPSQKQTETAQGPARRHNELVSKRSRGRTRSYKKFEFRMKQWAVVPVM
jgi:hypothetical protein